jgi:hypothetical protein
VAQRLDRDREIYEPVFIGRVVSFIDVAALLVLKLDRGLRELDLIGEIRKKLVL